MKISYIAIGINIQAARKSLGLTQEQVAEILELSPNYYSQLERGVKKVSLTRLADIAIAFNVPLETLVAGALMGNERQRMAVLQKDVSFLQMMSCIAQGCPEALKSQMLVVCEALANHAKHLSDYNP